jgi:hypothetical protein
MPARARGKNPKEQIRPNNTIANSFFFIFYSSLLKWKDVSPRSQSPGMATKMGPKKSPFPKGSKRALSLMALQPRYLT